MNKFLDIHINDLNGISHEIWAAAQLFPGEGIEDGVNRIIHILKENQCEEYAGYRYSNDYYKKVLKGI